MGAPLTRGCWPHTLRLNHYLSDSPLWTIGPPLVTMHTPFKLLGERR
jgi:hypothetical protein